MLVPYLSWLIRPFGRSVDPAEAEEGASWSKTSIQEWRARRRRAFPSGINNGQPCVNPLFCPIPGIGSGQATTR